MTFIKWPKRGQGPIGSPHPHGREIYFLSCQDTKTLWLENEILNYIP